VADWFASPAGVIGNTGAIGSPWDIDSTLLGHSGAIQPGDNVWLRGGTYPKAVSGVAWDCQLIGAVGSGADNRDSKIVIRNYLGDTLTNGERVIFEMTVNSAAPTAGATTVNGVNGAGSPTVSIAKGAGVNQAVIVGHQLVIASGPAAGVYVITAPATIIQGGNTSVSITPNLRGATAGGEVVTLKLTPVGVDGVQLTGAKFTWFWGIEFKAIFPLRTLQGGGQMWSSFNQITDGNKLIECLVHDSSGGCFVGEQSGRTELYGNILYNQGVAEGDGGGHHMYVHHTDVVKRVNIEKNIMFQDEGIAAQLYDAAGAANPIRNIDFIFNVAFLSGTLNNLPNIGGVDAVTFVIGGPQRVEGVVVDDNFTYQPDGKGDTHIRISEAGRLMGVGMSVQRNYLYGAGMGFANFRIAATIDPGVGTITVRNNTLRVPPNQNNSRLIYVVENGGAGYTWGPNTYYRAAGAGEPPIVAFRDATGGFRTLAQFLADCGFSGDTIQNDPTTTIVFLIPVTKYSPGRAHVVYYNYANLANIPIAAGQLGSILNVGDTYVVHDVRNIWAGMGGEAGAPVLGPTVWNGADVNLPNTQLATPVMSGSQWGIGNETTPANTAPFFNAFLIRRTAVAAGGGGGVRKKLTKVTTLVEVSSVD